MGSVMAGVDPRLLELIVCPRDRTALHESHSSLTCEQGHVYGVVDGVPVLLLDDEEDFTHYQAKRSLVSVQTPLPDQMMPAPAENEIDPWVNRWIGATNGGLYRPLQGKLKEYPIPTLRLPPGNGRSFLEVGCNWGRWCIAAARAGYRPIGIDPALGGIRAARHVAAQLKVDALYVVGDGRYLPFRDDFFDQVFSYSVLQHLSKENTRATLREVLRVLRPDGESLIQMANGLGIRSIYNQMRHWFVKTHGFEVRYWLPGELRSAFLQELGPTRLEVDGFFSLNPQASDLRFLPPRYQMVVHASEIMRTIARVCPLLKYAADSLYLRTTPKSKESIL